MQAPDDSFTPVVCHQCRRESTPPSPRRRGCKSHNHINQLQFHRKKRHSPHSKLNAIAGKRGRNRAIAELGWREFLDILKDTAEGAGIPFVEVPPSGTSQDCSSCGTKVPKALSERIQRCGVCGPELDPRRKRGHERTAQRPADLRSGRAVGEKAQGAPAASTARYIKEQKTRRLGSTEGSSMGRTAGIWFASRGLDFCESLKSDKI